jgi:hypothetical protein
VKAATRHQRQPLLRTRKFVQGRRVLGHDCRHRRVETFAGKDYAIHQVDQRKDPNRSVAVGDDDDRAHALGAHVLEGRTHGSTFIAENRLASHQGLERLEQRLVISRPLREVLP